MVWFSSRIIWNLVFLKHLTVWMEACKCYCVPLYFDPFQLKYSVLCISGVLYDDVSCLLVQTLSDRQKQYTQVSLWYHPLHMTDVFIFLSCCLSAAEATSEPVDSLTCWEMRTNEALQGRGGRETGPGSGQLFPCRDRVQLQGWFVPLRFLKQLQ